MADERARRKLALPRLRFPVRRAKAARAPSERSAFSRAMTDLRALSRRYSLLRDVLGGILIVALVVGGVAGATGGIWPPVLAVESGSMMHSSLETSYGRVGTIDVGDLVFVRAVEPSDIELWVHGGEDHYRRPGDVIAYHQDGDRGPDNLTILHRAITFVTVTHSTNGLPAYSFEWIDGETKTFGSEGIYFAPLGFDESYGFTRTNGYRPAYSGFLTKGDNAFTNPVADQAAGISKIVHPDWVVGEIYGEVPWMGLAKLMLQSGRTNPEVFGWERIGNAFAPIELWSCFFLVVAFVVVVPFSVGTWKAWREGEARRRARRRAVPDHVIRTRPARPEPPREEPVARSAND